MPFQGGDRRETEGRVRAEWTARERDRVVAAFGLEAAARRGCAGLGRLESTDRSSDLQKHPGASSIRLHP